MSPPLADSAVRVNEVEFIGADNTREWVVEAVLRPLLTSGTQSMGDLLRSIQETCAQFNQLEIFKGDIDVQMDQSNDIEITSKDGKTIITPIDITFRGKERSRIFVKTGTEVGANEGSVYFAFHARNYFGTAEHFEATVARGSRTRTSFQALFSKPLMANPRNVLELSAFQNEQNWVEQSSSTESQRGLAAKLKTLSRFGAHEFGVETVWRELGQLASTASFSIRESAGHTIKNAISHAVVRDTRDNRVFPTHGNYWRMFSELASVTGHSNNLFLKNEIEAQLARRPFKNLILSVTVKGGLLTTNGPTSSIHDRFFIGGPLTLRGFQTRGIGPKSVPTGSSFQYDSLGGDIYWTAGLSAFTPAPWLGQYEAVRLHFFANAGSLSPLDCGGSVKAIPTKLRHMMASTPISSSIGAGLLINANSFRLEVNATTPVTMSASDRRSPTLQFGLGMEFL